MQAAKHTVEERQLQVAVALVVGSTWARHREEERPTRQSGTVTALTQTAELVAAPLNMTAGSRRTYSMPELALGVERCSATGKVAGSEAATRKAVATGRETASEAATGGETASEAATGRETASEAATGK